MIVLTKRGSTYICMDPGTDILGCVLTGVSIVSASQWYSMFSTAVYGFGVNSKNVFQWGREYWEILYKQDQENCHVPKNTTSVNSLSAEVSVQDLVSASARMIAIAL